MKVLEVKNNLVKIEYRPADNLILSGFVIIEDSKSPYVAQVLSLKADKGINYAIVKLLFTFNEEGIVKNYDGTIPSLDADVTRLGSDELLDILPVNTPLEIGTIAHQNINLKVDMSIFEKNLLICSDNCENSNILSENFIYQLDENGCKTLFFDTDGSFAGDKLVFGKDFKLPLNYETINYIYDHELCNIDPTSKAIIQDIFLEVQEYSKTVLDKFIPFEDFLNVITQQYKELGIPELILLKNKLLKYKEMDVFAQTAKEIQDLRSALRANSANVLDISSAEEVLQSEIIKYVYNTIDEMDLFVYSFVQLNNDNADKRLIRHILGKSKIYTTIIASHNFKYLYELKERSNNLILFAPQVMQHDFTAYNTFLNKLNQDEFVIYGKATQNIPLIVELSSVFNEDEQEISEQTPIQQAVEQKDEIINDQNEDDFSEESNSYSYETLIKDTAVNVPTVAPTPQAVVEAISKPEPQMINETEPQDLQPLPKVEEIASEQVEENTTSSDVQADNKITTEDDEETAVDDEIEEEISDEMDEDSQNELQQEMEDDSDTIMPSDDETNETDAPSIESEEMEQTVEDESEEDFEETEDSEQLSDDDAEQDDVEEREDDEEQDNESEEQEEYAVDTETISNIIDKEIEAEIYTNPDNDIIEGEFQEIEELPNLESAIEQSELNLAQEDKIELPPLEEIAPDLNSTLMNNETESDDKLTSGTIDDFLSEEEMETTEESDETTSKSQEDLTEDDLNFIQKVNTPVEESSLPVYPAEDLSANSDAPSLAAGDHVSHPKYGEGIVEKMIRYGTKTLCSISFINVGRRLLDPAISEITKLG